MLVLQNFINGKFVDGKKFIDGFDPSNGKIYAQIPDSDNEEVEMAVNAAKSAFLGWKTFSSEARSKIMLKVADIIESRIDEFALAESKDQGKPVWLAKQVDITRVVHNFRFFASAILHTLNHSTEQPEFDVLNYTVNVPCGVVGLITPWNLPLYLLSFKLAPAIACGCCVVAKPSEMTSVTAWMLCNVLSEAGLPPGVVNIVFGTGKLTGNAIVTHPEIKTLSFTGSTVTGKYIMEKSSSFMRKFSLELGGKNAAVIFPDANIEKCLLTCVRSAFTNQGEICLCTSRLFVHQDIFKMFCERYVSLIRELKVGNPSDASTKIGALVSKEHLEKVKTYIKYAIEDGGTILCGETIDCLDLPEEIKEGYYFQPTVLVNLSDMSRCMQEEIFGPVVCISPFTTEEEVISRVNNVPYGLSACVWSQNASTLQRVSGKLDVGTVWCNCWMIRDLRMPFGGMKMSGLGREGQDYSFDFFMEKKTICMQF
uniref:Aldehyde dehydrogenase family 8 member A1 n=1 Tax=Hydra vulgaris TaxID=6087 RepID=T2M660_HYDVU